MAFTYNRVNQESTGGGGGSGTPYSELFNIANWGSAVGGYYTITILASIHGKGTSPGVQVFLSNTGNYELAEVDLVSVNGSGDVTIRVLEIPDLRFNGRVVILN